MGKGGRFVCIFMPMVLTAAALVCLVLVGVGGLNRSSSVQSSLYFFKANTTDISINGVPISSDLINAATSSNTTELEDIYYIYFNNYCSGLANGTITYCSPRTNFFYFDPETAWGLSDALADELFTEDFQHALNIYKEVAHWMWIALIVAVAATGVTFLVGFSAIFSRWGSFITSGFAGIAMIFSIGWAGTMTATYVILDGAFNTSFKKYDVSGSLGRDGLAVAWLACAFSLIASFWWTLSICCCSGRSSHSRDKRTSAVYEPIYPARQVQYFNPQKPATAV